MFLFSLLSPSLVRLWVGTSLQSWPSCWPQQHFREPGNSWLQPCQELWYVNILFLRISNFNQLQLHVHVCILERVDISSYLDESPLHHPPSLFSQNFFQQSDLWPAAPHLQTVPSQFYTKPPPWLFDSQSTHCVFPVTWLSWNVCFKSCNAHLSIQ